MKRLTVAIPALTMILRVLQSVMNKVEGTVALAVGIPKGVPSRRERRIVPPLVIRAIKIL
jgi:hypothetical protein